MKISLSLTQKKFHIMVEDDGKGFEPTRSLNTAKTKFGLDIMRERAAEIGGDLAIESAPGKGCRIALCVPVEEEDENNEIDAGG